MSFEGTFMSFLPGTVGILTSALTVKVRLNFREFLIKSINSVIQWTLVIVNSGLSPILFTNERFSLLPESMIFSFITYN